MPQSENKGMYWICDDTDYIGSEIPDDGLVGFLEFTDGAMLVCAVGGDSSIDSGSTGTTESSEEVEQPSPSDEDLDEIPF